MKQKIISKNRKRILGLFTIYNLLLLPFLPLLPFILFFFALFSKRIRVAFPNRFGFISGIKRLKGKILVHSASVGEFNGIRPFLKQMEQSHKEFALSAFTDTGLQNMKHNMPDRLSFILPLDNPIFLFSIFLNRPSAVIITETELWPNFIMLCGLLNIPLYLINGRVSKKRSGLILKARPFYRILLSCFKSLYLQDKDTAIKLNQIGIHSRMEVTGSTKLDISHIIPPNKKHLSLLMNKLFLQGKTVITGGSLREDEFKLMVDAFKEMHTLYPKTSLILAPRHLTDIPEYIQYIESKELEYSRFSDEKKNPHVPIILIDKMGILMDIYYISDIVFVGGTIAPIGGHNPVEPAYADNAILHGSSISNNYPAFQLLVKTKGSLLVNRKTIGKTIGKLLSNPKLVTQLKKNALTAIKSQSSISRTIYEKIFVPS